MDEAREYELIDGRFGLNAAASTLFRRSLAVDATAN